MKILIASLALISLAGAQHQHQQQQFQQQYNNPQYNNYYNNHQFAFRQEAEGQSASGVQGPSTTPIPIISYVNEVNPDGSYHFSYETGNSIKAEESGRLNNAGSENEVIQVQGAYSYVGDDGQTYSVQYTADENGFQPQGAHLPTPPPLPIEVQKAIEEHMAALATATPEETSEAAPAAGQEQFFLHRHF